MLCALACIYIGNKGDDNNWWQSWAVNSDSASTHHNSLDLKTIGQIVYDSSSFSQLVVNPAETATLGDKSRKEAVFSLWFTCLTLWTFIELKFFCN